MWDQSLMCDIPNTEQLALSSPCLLHHPFAFEIYLVFLDLTQKTTKREPKHAKVITHPHS